MSNVAKVLKAEIARTSKREARSATQGIGKSNTWLRKTVADLKKRLSLLDEGAGNCKTVSFRSISLFQVLGRVGIPPMDPG